MVFFVSLLRPCIFVLIWQTRTLAVSPSPGGDCAKLLKTFAEVVSNYTYCAVNNSRPFRFCCVCEKVYVTALNGHRSIVQDNDCHNDLVLAEKYQIVESAYDFVVNLWKSSNCPACFENDKDGTPKEIKTEITEFFHKLDAVEHCFYNNSQIHVIPVPVNHSASNSSAKVLSVCDSCDKSYGTLKESYKNIESGPEGYKVCADVSASMNYTRQRWSNNFHCVKIHSDLVSVVALTVFFCFLPIIFYTSLRLQGTASKDKKLGTSLRVNHR
ncbi:osteoclast differentiation [Desmophyllum pertusum]|uniref:Osteoclast differentiation n=1 Tax=Desmophyllum pertusum TaxID=174260 RepID=A0A9X0CNL9_9CNID|nr:osteoclast differentiation [Desmophyllum pertusum]